MIIRKGEVVQVKTLLPELGTFIATAKQDFDTVEQYFCQLAPLKYVSGNARNLDGEPYTPGEDISTVKGLCTFLILRRAQITQDAVVRLSAPDNDVLLHARRQESFDILAAHIRSRGNCEQCDKPVDYLCDCDRYVCDEHYRNGCFCNKT